mmetsp:Transcript_22471/g.32800  ORF Transcript_22471/g.32800 Transcript_22471/m.32800 type:complete len:365 (-) Transcript_22471:96-1190(-)
MASSKSKHHFLDIGSFSQSEFTALADMDKTERQKEIRKHTKTTWTEEDTTSIAPMTLMEELFALIIFVFGVPGSAYSVPIVLAVVGYFLGSVVKTIVIGFAILAPFAFLPAPFFEKSLSTWYSLQILRYFSFKCIYAEPIEENKPHILVAPPHGVFPFGNIVTMIAFPSIMGFSFLGLASSAALRMPIFRQLLCTIGVIDASRASATKALNNNHTIGISTGGVAEVFETNSKTGHEVVVLQSRKGLVKLAMRTGASLVPCYLFGNTRLYSLWCGGDGWLRSVLCWISRKLGFALILFWGRFFLPLPYRIPIVGVMSKPIPVTKCENPSNEEVDRVHALLLEEMVKLFDEHKASYGWADKKLIIK